MQADGQPFILLGTNGFNEIGADVRIENLQLETGGDEQTLRARLVWEHAALPNQELYFRCRFGSPLIQRSVEPILLAAAVPAMLAGEKRVHVEQNLDPVLASGIPSALAILKNWMPEFFGDCRIPEIDATLSSKAVADSRGTASFFSGGVDALYTLLRNQQMVPSDDPSAIKFAIMVYGFDLGYSGRDETILFKRISEQAEDYLQERGVRLLCVETNLREMDGPSGFWGRAFHGFALAAVAHLFDGFLEQVLIGTNGEPLSDSVQMPWGGHPAVFSYLCSKKLQLRSPYVEVNRINRVRAISNDEKARTVLRVCFRHGTRNANCGRCEKCIRTRLALLVVGGDPNSGFDGAALHAEQIAKIDISSDVGQIEHEELVSALRDKNFDDILRAEMALLRRWDRFKRWRDGRGVKGAVKRAVRRIFSLS